MKHPLRERRSSFRNNWGLYLLLLPALVYALIFLYLPMVGVVIAFTDYSPTKGFFGSPWVGIKYFKKFFESYNFWQIFYNTVALSFYNLIATFPIPIIFALLLNQMRLRSLKKVIQTASYAPYFISVVVLVGMMNVFFSPSSGIVNVVIKTLGGTPVYIMGKPELFRPIYVRTNVWQTTGRSAIIYIAALTGVSMDLHEAAMVDGANKLQRTLHIDIPGILPTAIIMQNHNLGQIKSIGIENAY